jgi:hypothetical protein
LRRRIELAARAFNAIVWRLDGPLNFPEVERREEAKFHTPPFYVVHCDEDRAVHREYMWMAVRQSYEAYMAAHPELEYYAQLAAQQAAAASGATSSTSSSVGQSAACASPSVPSSITIADSSTEMDTE